MPYNLFDGGVVVKAMTCKRNNFSGSQSGITTPHTLEQVDVFQLKTFQARLDTRKDVLQITVISALHGP